MTASLNGEENLQQTPGGENKLQAAACQRPERNDWVSDLNSPHLGHLRPPLEDTPDRIESNAAPARLTEVVIPRRLLDRTAPWTEQDYLALGETVPRVELLDGGLLIGPPASLRHQVLVGGLADTLAPGARARGFDILPMINLRLGGQRILNPDLVVAAVSDFDALSVPAAEVLMVAEVAAPHTIVIDSLLKLQCYADAGIQWYLLIEQETLTMHLYQRQGGHYVERSVTKAGEVLELTDPVRATIRPEELLG
ncbi:Uma2 family endonuclease [Micromonospora chersina]|uniref:Uma2 family endonuclease n=1 Tax=Micromonospora chersina TaxID=47854 RepID=UPI00371A9839